MRTTADELLSQRLQCDEQILATLATHATRLEAARKGALSALTTAQERLTAIESELDDVKTRHASLAQSVQVMHHRLRPRPMDAFPLELLREIFLILALPPSTLWPNDGYGKVDRLRARLPFNLAAVCRHWRDLALKTPTLWSYIGVPAPGLQPERRTYYFSYWVTTLLERSKTAPLDICLPWARDSPWEVASYSDRIMNLLVNHTLRWRHFEFSLPRGWLNVDTMGHFQHPTPLLETFFLSGRSRDTDCIDWDFEPPSPRYLPICPKLAHCRSDYTNVLYAVPRPPLTSIRTLEMTVQMFGCNVLWNLLRAAPALEVLRIAFIDDDEADLEEAPDAPVHLPCLRELNISSDVSMMFAAALDALSLPSLRVLDIDPDSVRILHAFFDSYAQGVTSLTVTDGAVVMDHASLLRPLLCLRQLTFTACTVEDEFLQALAVSGKWIFPRLEHIMFSGCTIDPWDGDGLAHVVRARETASQSDGTPAPSRIRAVTIDSSSDVPTWLIAEVRYLLAEEVVVPVDRDPVIEDITARGPDEPEAQFTDGEDSSDDGSDSSFELASEDAGEHATDESDEDYEDESSDSEDGNKGEHSCE